MILRFLPEGPSIPDELLVARDEGRVVFFCGAGVSLARARLTDFLGLTKKVTDQLAVAPNSPTRRLIEAIEKFPPIPQVGSLVSADRVFGLIEREFTQRDIYAAIASCLRPAGTPDLTAHKILLDLAKGPDGRTRLVTTNFDLLFEACDPTLASSKPPRLPDPLRDNEFVGIIHLHGHVTEDYATAAGDGFVISSAEFGRAYLSERWATDFIRSVLERYIVVFVGYAADDPPMQYLLEALNRTAGSLSGVYAFQSGSLEDAEARWIQKGVKPIAYDQKSDHDALWKTLEAWAIRARNPEDWHAKLIKQALRGPEAMEPYQRGQIAHIVSTAEGARRFANAPTPAPANWLCSFDPYVRFAMPAHTGEMFEGQYFDPFDSYGLDSDPVPKKISPDDSFAKREVPSGVWDCFAPTRQDRQNLRDEHFSAFRGHYSQNVPRLSSRLDHIERWIARVANQPAAVWWASRQHGLHPDVQKHIRYQIEQNSSTFSPAVRKAWRYVFNSRRASHQDAYADWFEAVATIKSDGWTPSIVRDIAQVKRPYFSSRNSYGADKAPANKRGVPLGNLLRLDVEFPEVNEEIEVPAKYLPSLVKELRRNLELGVSLESEIGGYGLDNLNPIADETHPHPFGINRCISDFVKFFRQLIERSPSAARRELIAWKENKDEVFSLLTIWANSDERISSSLVAGKTFSSLDRKTFWSGRLQRDLLIALAKRWPALGLKDRKIIERKLLEGRSTWKGESPENFQHRRAHQILGRINWLAMQGCKFTFDLAEEVLKLKKQSPDWKDEYAASAAESMASRAEWVETKTESDALSRVPLSEVLPNAKALSGRRGEAFVQYDPYAGLATAKPARALAALKAAPKGDWHWAWETFLSSQARKDDKPRLVTLIAGRIANLSESDFPNLVRAISDWLLRASKPLLASQRTLFDSIWKRLIKCLNADESAGDSSVITQNKQHDWATEALNSPAGHLGQALFNDLDEKVTKETGLPEEWKTRANQLLSLPGDARRHALAIFCHNLTYLFHLDPAWTEKALVSALDHGGDDAEAFWAGFFWGARAPQETLYLKMKPALLALARESTLTKRQHTENLASILLIGWNGRLAADGNRAISDEEMRTVVLEGDDEFRSQLVWQLDNWSKSKDKPLHKEALLFLRSVWPKQVAAKTPGVSARLAELALSHEEEFPEYVDAILPLVIPIDRDHIMLPSLRRSKERSVIEKFPEKTLQLLDAILPDDGRKWPYGIDDVLSRLGQTSAGSDARLARLNHIWNAR